MAIQIAAIPCAVFGTDLTTTAASYTLAAASVTKFKVAVTAPADPAACPAACPKPNAQLVCKGACPARCHCDGSWVLAIVAGAPALAEAPGLAFALSETDVDVDADGSSAVYDSFATGAWQTAAFVTAHRHENVKGQKFSHNTVEFGQVDLCKATSPGKAASAKEQTLASLDCNCDDCASSCGVKDSRKADSCASLIGGDGFDWQASRCTYYAASSDLSAEATGADYCCNAVPSAFIAEVGALPGVPRPFDWMAAPRVAFPVVDGRACTADEPPVQSVSSYRVPAITYHDCARASMADGDYFLYAVNTKAAAATLELSYEARSVTAAEAHACYAADYSATNGARGWGRPSAGALLAALALLALAA